MEEIAISSRTADRGDRLLAHLIDSGIVFGLGLVSVFITFLLDESGVLMLAMFGVGSLGILVYNANLLTVYGQTIGKRVMKIKIVQNDSELNGGFVTNFLVRGVLNSVIVGVVPGYGLIDVLLIFSSDYRCLHDLIAGTKVIKA